MSVHAREQTSEKTTAQRNTEHVIVELLVLSVTFNVCKNKRKGNAATKALIRSTVGLLVCRLLGMALT